MLQRTRPKLDQMIKSRPSGLGLAASISIDFAVQMNLNPAPQ
jgi:hypothetical protein